MIQKTIFCVQNIYTFLYAAEIRHFQSIFSQQDIQNVTPYVIYTVVIPAQQINNSTNDWTFVER